MVETMLWATGWSMWTAFAVMLDRACGGPLDAETLDACRRVDARRDTFRWDHPCNAMYEGMWTAEADDFERMCATAKRSA